MPIWELVYENSVQSQFFPKKIEIIGQDHHYLLTFEASHHFMLFFFSSTSLQFVVNIDPVPGEEAPYNVPLWIYIIAGVAGILLLGIISLILWKVQYRNHNAHNISQFYLDHLRSTVCFKLFTSYMFMAVWCIFEAISQFI